MPEYNADTNSADAKPLTMEVIVSRPTSVKISQLTLNDLLSMDKDQLSSFAYGLIKMLEVQTPTDTSTEALKAVPINPPPRNSDGQLGIKRGKSSLYHYVCFSKRDNKFVAQLREGKKCISIGRFTDEKDAAVAVDLHLDYIGDTKRPRNRDEFPEIKKGYSI